jgi:hypothetical protein
MIDSSYLKIKVCSLIARKSMHRFSLKLACLFPETRKIFLESQNFGTVFRARVPLRAVPLASCTSIGDRREETGLLSGSED